MDARKKMERKEVKNAHSRVWGWKVEGFHVFVTQEKNTSSWSGGARYIKSKHVVRFRRVILRRRDTAYAITLINTVLIRWPRRCTFLFYPLRAINWINSALIYRLEGAELLIYALTRPTFKRICLSSSRCSRVPWYRESDIVCIIIVPDWRELILPFFLACRTRTIPLTVYIVRERRDNDIQSITNETKNSFYNYTSVLLRVENARFD